MRLALVGWATDTGVGRELTDAARQFPEAAVFVLPHARFPTRYDALPPHAVVVPALGDLREPMRRFLDLADPDVVLTWEVPGAWEFPDLWKAAGIRWANVVHWDWFAPESMNAWKYADLVAPNTLCQEGLRDRYGLRSTLLPVPLDTDRFPFTPRRWADTFVTVYGQGGPYDRRSMGAIAAAWKRMGLPPRLLIRARRPPPELPAVPKRAELDLGERADAAALYDRVEVAVLPSRYEGVGLSLLEAQACGCPVITVDAPPMNEVAPDLLVPVEATHEETIMKGHAVAIHTVSVKGLAEKVMDVSGTDIEALSRAARDRVETRYSWKALKTSWVRYLEGSA